jgi:lipopolysaccharide transport system ATP-binding protein
VSDIAIKVENLSKRYRIGLKEELHDTFGGALTSWVKYPLANFKRLQKLSRFSENGDSDDIIWAIKDVSFEVKRGEVLGIIGKNGAGKSTLLKILCRITEPTSGEASIHGRVASLLEVGTGFHPELTGRENIYLNGTILGMTKVEVDSKFDEIVDFSGIEKFIDTPVKRYSSGMSVRLAFSVAAHLEPEILLIDEVLAVGDAEFQKKAIGKMKQVSKGEGRTVLIVSHNMTSIQALCSSAVVLTGGRSTNVKDVRDAVNEYLGGGWRKKGYLKIEDTRNNKDAIILEAKLLNDNNELTETFATFENIYMEIVWKNVSGVKVNPNFMITNRQEVTVIVALDATIDWTGEKKKEKGVYVSRVKIPGNLLNVNDYIVHLALDCGSPRICYDSVLDALSFNVWDPMDERCLARGNFSSVREDAILWPALEWSFKKI